jgi:hypothetical protein
MNVIGSPPLNRVPRVELVAPAPTRDRNITMTKTRLPTDVHLRFTTLTSVLDYTLYTPEMRGGKAHVAIESNYSENNSYCIGFRDSAVADLEGGPLESTSGNVDRQRQLEH